MITRFYANNFRCLVAFKTEIDSFGVLCGPNGAGKSSVFDALRLIRNLATGDAYLGGSGERDIPPARVHQLVGEHCPSSSNRKPAQRQI